MKKKLYKITKIIQLIDHYSQFSFNKDEWWKIYEIDGRNIFLVTSFAMSSEGKNDECYII